ncbi:MAG: DNA polymerase III subunit chi [Burkholderiaceae bacterium]
MTEIAFHFNAPDKLAYACRLLRKAVGTGAQVVVTAEPESLQRLDAALWTFAPLEFVAHCHADSDATMLAASPVVLAASLDALPHQQVLVNLGDRIPDGFERFERLIEVVSLDDADRQGARRRWKHYADRGYALMRHDLALKGQS